MNAIAVDFRSLISLAGSVDGARTLFERLVVAIMRLKYRDAQNLRAKQGDWGIDCFSGLLSGGNIVVWQAKYFLDGLGDSQKTQVRESFKSLMKASADKHFTVTSWTLCVPCQLAPDEETWWEGWKRTQQKNTGVKINLLNEDGLREMLMKQDAQHILLGTFGSNPTWIEHFAAALRSGPPERDILDLPDPVVLDDAVFVQQLRAAEVTEMRSAKKAFFNAEVMTQEVLDKGDPQELRELRVLTGKIQALWETGFNSYAITDTKPALFYSQTMQSIIENSELNLRSFLTAATFVHKQGIGHQLADKCEIGWVRDFRQRFIDPQGASA